MKKIILNAAVLSLIILVGVIGSICLAQVTWDQISREELNIKSALIDADNPKIIYMGSDGVLKSQDGGDSWRSVLLVQGQNKSVNFLAFGAQDKSIVYAATASGLFYSHNQGENWKRIFRGKNYLEDECLTVAQLASRVFLGTRGGLFISSDNGRHWFRPAGKLGTSQVLSIAYDYKDNNCLYAACVDGVFKTIDAGDSWERVFALDSIENPEGGDEGLLGDLDEAEEVSRIRFIASSPDKPGYLCLAASRGVYKSDDAGKNWEVLSSYGLLSSDVRFLLFSLQGDFYASTKSGIFAYKNERWNELSIGLAPGQVNSLSLDKQNNLYAACAKGLFKAKLTGSSNLRANGAIDLYLKDEPDIKAVQQAAVRYAEAQPDKIAQWRAQAAKKAMLPQVSVGVTRDTGDLWHWESGSTTKSDDDILRKGRDNLDWNISLSWNLGELVWNDDQASIDARSRLNTQLRGDILDQVTKLYFERLRVKIEMDNLAIEDRKKSLEKELKLEELSASLNALTGGYFLKDKG